MDPLAIVTLIIATIVSTAFQVKSTPVMPETQQLREEDRGQTPFDDPDPNQQERIVTFLALLDKVEQSARARFAAQITGVRAGTKLLGKKNRMDDLREEHANPSFHQEESPDQTDDLPETNPARGKPFRKVAQPLPRKGKKRACFWKYCIQNK